MTESSIDLTDEELELVEHLTEVEEDSDRICETVPKLSVAQLHAFCCAYNWADDSKPLHVALALPHCDRGTALAVYWLSEPSEWAGRDSVAEHERKTYDLFKAAERRLIADDFTNRTIELDIRSEFGGVDAYWDEIAQNGHIPENLKPH